MNLLKKLFATISVATILLALPCSAAAIGFQAENTYESVLVVTSGNALGSGFAIGENCIVTNAHVLADPQNIHLTTYSGQTHTATLVGMDTQKDVAVLAVADTIFPHLKIADYTAMQIGDDVYAVGAPKSMAYTLTKGVISAKERPVGDQIYIQTDAAINQGNSGGPLLNDAGNVIGINTLKMSDSEGIGLAIPMSLVNAFLATLNIPTDENGNVTESVTVTKEGIEETVPETRPQPKPEADSPMRRYTAALLIGFCLSLGLNVLLVTQLIFQKKKNLKLICDPRERTDFDIDILG